MQPKPINQRENDFLILLPIPNVTTKHFGELLLQKMRCRLCRQQKAEPGLSPSLSLQVSRILGR